MNTPTPLTQLPIHKLPPRVLGVLNAWGIHSVELLCRCCPAELLEIRNFGPSALEHVEQALSDAGLALSPDPGSDSYTPWSKAWDDES